MDRQERSIDATARRAGHYTKNIGRNRREFDVRILQDLMDPVFMPGPLLG